MPKQAQPERLSHFSYLYRDAGNFKVYNRLLIAGAADPESVRTLLSTLESGEFFIPEQVGIPPLQNRLTNGGGLNRRLDHAWHSIEAIEEFEDSYSNAEQLWGTMADLVRAFRNVREWDVRFSPAA